MNHIESKYEPSLLVNVFDLEEGSDAEIDHDPRIGRQDLKTNRGEAIEPKVSVAATRRGTFSEFLGVWKQHEAEEFASATADLRRTDKDDWR